MKTGQLITAFCWALITALFTSLLTFGITETAEGHHAAPLIVLPALMLLAFFIAFLVVLKDSERR